MATRRERLHHNFTQDFLIDLPSAAPGTTDTWHDDNKKAHGLQVRVTATGCKTYYIFQRNAVTGQPERVKLGVVGKLTLDQARAAALKVSNDLAQGNSPMAAKRAARVKASKMHTLKAAVEIFVETKERIIKVNGREVAVPLKDRTKEDYLGMVKPGQLKPNGRRTLDGELCALADKPIDTITADDVRALHSKLKERSARRAGYAMATLRTVLKGFGVIIPNDPFGNTVPQLSRIHLTQSGVSESVIEPEQIGRWWNVINGMEETRHVAYLKFLVLTGCRPSEPLKVLVSDCDLANGIIELKDTKNRKNHWLVLSTQAQEIVNRQTQDKAPTDRLFDFFEVSKKTIKDIREATGIQFSAKTLRATFATLADDLVSAGMLKRMMNHTMAGDVTNAHYIKKNKEQLRLGWQKVADFIEQQAATADNVVKLAESA